MSARAEHDAITAPERHRIARAAHAGHQALAQRPRVRRADRREPRVRLAVRADGNVQPRAVLSEGAAAPAVRAARLYA